MATIIERERPAERGVIVERNTDSGAGWAVALIVIIAVLAVAAFAFARYYRAPAAATPAGNSINVSVPAPSTGTTGGATTGGGTTGGTGAPAGSSATGY